MLADAAADAARRSRRREAPPGAGPPVLLGVPETHYLKCFVLRKLA